jgi:hypothetical protein
LYNYTINHYQKKSREFRFFAAAFGRAFLFSIVTLPGVSFSFFVRYRKKRIEEIFSLLLTSLFSFGTKPSLIPVGFFASSCFVLCVTFCALCLACLSLRLVYIPELDT